MIRVAVIGASGYAGGELVRYLLMHPGVEVSYLASSTYAGRPLSDAFGSLLGQDLPECEEFDVDRAVDAADFFFLAQGNGSGMKLAPELLEYGKKIVDVPADFRLKDLSVYRSYYGMEHTAPDLAEEAVYGLSEVRGSEISEARLVANPGCYATCALLGLAPLVAAGITDLRSLIVDAKSGVSGAGRSKADVPGLFCEVNEGFKAYGVATHRHTPEIEQEVSAIAGEPVTLSFTPHLAPMNRGILATIYASVREGANMPATAALIEIYRDFYSGRPFVCVLDDGRQPNTKSVFGTNFCHIGLVADPRTRRVIVTSAIDNMGKGAAGQAIQNLNLMSGLEEDTGLMMPAVFP